MFWLRGLVIAAGVFATVYVGVSAAVAALSRASRCRRAMRRIGGGSLLFGARMSPLWAAAAVVALLTVPSYFYLEPRNRDEGIGAAALFAAALAAVILVSGAWRTAVALVRAARFRKDYLRRSQRTTTAAGQEIYRFPDERPAVLVAGILRPTVLVSSGASAMLDAAELSAAVRHELAHVQHGDNLKKLLLRCCGFPLLGSLEAEWQGQVEIDADAAAASDQRQALDLASALVKMARAPAWKAAPHLSVALVSGPEHSIRERVERLVDHAAPPRRHRWAMYSVLFLGGTTLAIHYAALLAAAHELSELFIR